MRGFPFLYKWVSQNIPKLKCNLLLNHRKTNNFSHFLWVSLSVFEILSKTTSLESGYCRWFGDGLNFIFNPPNYLLKNNFFSPYPFFARALGFKIKLVGHNKCNTLYYVFEHINENYLDFIRFIHFCCDVLLRIFNQLPGTTKWSKLVDQLLIYDVYK